ncbi:hypothetical protein [Photobacterium damselae]|uniref:hypothetical protein n=1 Tax=Photobacterium damselae TaxID=38293 RepID=UPI0030F37E81
MKKTLIALAALASLGMATSATAADKLGQGSFQWAGTVPTISSGDGFFIVPAGSTTDLNGGILTFSNKLGKVELNGSTELSFKVVKDAVAGDAYDPSVDKTPLTYKGTLTNIKVGVNSLLAEQANNGYFAIAADGSVMDINDADAINKDVAVNNVTHLTVKKNTKLGAAASGLNGGDNVVVQALVAITADVI